MPETPASEMRRLRTALRRHRDALGLTQREVADALEWSLSKMIRIEKGPIGISISDLKALLRYYEVTEDGEVRGLVEMARGSKKVGWWHAYRDIVSPGLLTYLGLEASAIHIRDYSDRIVPGLLQTEAYARALLEKYKPAKDLDRYVGLRMHRQKLLKPEGPQASFIFDESALYRTLGSDELMSAQLKKIKQVAEYPHVRVQILPFSAGLDSSMSDPLTIFEFDGEQNDFAVFIDKFSRAVLLEENSTTIEERIAHFVQLEAISLSEKETTELIDQALSGLDSDISQSSKCL